jgi:hypothetical protein
MNELKKQAGNFYKLPQMGQQARILLMTQPVEGYSYWTEEGQVRTKHHPTSWDDAKVYSDGKQDRPKQFSTFAVWDFDTRQVSLLEVTQWSILTAISDAAAEGTPLIGGDFGLRIARPQPNKYTVSLVMLATAPWMGASKYPTDGDFTQAEEMMQAYEAYTHDDSTVEDIAF